MEDNMTIETNVNGLIPKTSLQRILGKQAVLVYPELAMIIGTSNSICWQQLNYWLNKESTTTVFEGRLWVYNTYEQWREQLPFLSEITIKRSFLELERMGLILSRQVGITKYYTIDYQALDSLFEEKLDDDHFDTDHFDTDHFDTQPVSKRYEPRIKMIRTYIDTKTTQRLHREEEHSASADSAFSENAPPPKEFEKTLKKKKERGSSLNEDWILPPEYRSWSLQIRMTNEEIDITALKFKNYWLSTTKNATKKDWYRTWQNWCFGDYNLKGKNLKLPDKPVSVVTVPETEIIKKSSNPKIQQWYNLQPALKDMVGDNDYISWFGSNLELIKADDKAILKASSKFLGDYVRLHYISYVSNILAQIDPNLGKEENIEFII
jgi:hypothetical protein